MNEKPTNVVTMTGAPAPEFDAPNENLIAVLEDTLTRAKTGELQSFIGTGFTSDDTRLVVWFDGMDVMGMMGALVWLQHEYAARHTTPFGG